MFTSLIVVGLALAGQVGGAADRYPPPRTTGQAAGTTASGNGAAKGGASVNSQSAPPGSGASRNSGTSPGSGNPYNPTPPPSFGSQRTIPLLDASGAPAAAGQAQSPPSSFQGQPSFPGDEPAAAQPGGGPQPSAMMQAMLTAPPRDSQLRGEPVRLVEVIGSARTRSEQTQRVEAYWDLCSSVADYYLGLREQDELRKLASFVPHPGATWQQAEKELGVRIGTSLRAARASQFRLASFIGRGPNNLPLPADMPHCGSYASHYEQIFSGRGSPEAQEVAGLLPVRYAELKDGATAVTRAEEWLDGVASRNENSDGTGSLRALELLALRRRAFVQIARDYNRRIARYSELASPGPISAERLTGMLIKRPTSSTATRSASPTPPPNRQSSSAETSPPRTFVEDWSPAANTRTSGAAKRDDGVQPASATQSAPKGDHSLLLPPK